MWLKFEIIYFKIIYLRLLAGTLDRFHQACQLRRPTENIRVTLLLSLMEYIYSLPINRQCIIPCKVAISHQCRISLVGLLSDQETF